MFFSSTIFTLIVTQKTLGGTGVGSGPRILGKGLEGFFYEHMSPHDTPFTARRNVTTLAEPGGPSGQAGLSGLTQARF